MNIVRYILLALLLALQYPLWFGSGSIPAVWHLRQQVEAQKIENAQLRERNKALVAEVMDLKHELGMVKEGETFFHVVEGSVRNRP
jgi:cell division protein FtsB